MPCRFPKKEMYFVENILTDIAKLKPLDFLISLIALPYKISNDLALDTKSRR